MEGVPFIPEVQYIADGMYYPVCRVGFEESNAGATLACVSLGFDYGVVEATFSTFDTPGIDEDIYILYGYDLVNVFVR